ncbi:MAG: Fe-S cluster assembly protein SufD [Candidatus Zixiibacteriota bacterium]|nr:MAG: Fe-S cluster assembly protein SufD [candidate division Zixibacteria bacterium]
MNHSTATRATDSVYLIDELAPALERGPRWLREKRQISRKAFNSLSLPRRGLHLWRYTDPEKFLIRHGRVIDTPFADDYNTVEKVALSHLKQGHLSGLVTDLGGREIKVYGTEELVEKGVVVSTLSEAVDKHQELVEKYLYQLVNGQTGKFEAMNGALFNDGIFIYVPDSVTVEKPLHLLRETGRENSAHFPRLLVVVGKNAELTIIDEYGGGSVDIDRGVSNTNSAVEIFGLEESRVRYVSLQRQMAAAHSYLMHRARIERGATMLTVPLAFGASISKQNFGVILNGEGAESKMYGLLFGSEDQHFDNHTLHHHAASRTVSNIDFKVVLQDRALSAYTGLIRIDKASKTCEAYQGNRNLLLNKGTKVETIPELEILNEDVKCSHGATIGPIDPLSVFYLTSRGIDRDDAVRMIVSGFVASTLKQIPKDLRERISNFVAQRLENI